MNSEITARRLESGYWIVRGRGPCNYSQPPAWPCGYDELRLHAHPEAGERFLRAAAMAAAEEQAR